MRKVIIGIFFVLVCIVTALIYKNMSNEYSVYLYGEVHGDPLLMEKELELWEKNYNEDGMRNLFIEYSFCDAQLLNIWMKEENDDILTQMFENMEGTAAHNDYWLGFYKYIKTNLPETVFYGNDIVHQQKNADMYLKYLEENSMENSEEYQIALENIKQGETYYGTKDDNEKAKNNSKELDDLYRENMLTENFIRLYDNLDDKRVIGFYGEFHTNITAYVYNYETKVPTMAYQLTEHYGDIVKSAFVRDLLK